MNIFWMIPLMWLLKQANSFVITGIRSVVAWGRGRRSWVSGARGNTLKWWEGLDWGYTKCVHTWQTSLNCALKTCAFIAHKLQLHKVDFWETDRKNQNAVGLPQRGDVFEKALSSSQCSGPFGLSQDLLEVMISFPAHKTSSPRSDSVSLTTSSDSDHPFWHVRAFFTSQSNSPQQPGDLVPLSPLWNANVMTGATSSRLMATKRWWGWEHVLRTAELKDKGEPRVLTGLWISVNYELPTSAFFHNREKYLSCLNQLFCVSLTEKAESSSYLL